MGLFSIFNKKTPQEREEEYYADLYEMYYGRKPRGRMTEAEKAELEVFEEEEIWDDD